MTKSLDREIASRLKNAQRARTGSPDQIDRERFESAKTRKGRIRLEGNSLDFTGTGQDVENG